ncbi:MAG: superoxide dismutase [Patescibacteria group bacterium]
MPFELPELPYSYDALEPKIDAKTMEIHYTKHHQGYVNNLNEALQGYNELQEKTLDELLQNLDSLPEAISTAVRNNGGGHYNHSLFWETMTPREGTDIPEKLQTALEVKFESMDKLKDLFKLTALGRFGSGWTWLTLSNGELTVYSTPNQDNPIMQGDIPLLGLDVWEHAYYLNYQNKRGDYIDAWWSLVDWEKVEEKYSAALNS